MFSGVQCTCLASQVAVRPCRASSALRRWPKWKLVGDDGVFVFMVLGGWSGFRSCLQAMKKGAYLSFECLFLLRASGRPVGK